MKLQPFKRLIVLIGLLALIGGIVLSCGGLENQSLEPVEAKKVAKKIEPLKVVKTIGKNSPKYIKMNSTHILIGGAKCGCGVNKNRYKHNHKVVIKNWCPYCAKKGWTAWGNLRYNSKRTIEGELSCRRCDADFCLCYNKKTGKGLYEKSGKKKFKLKKW